MGFFDFLKKQQPVQNVYEPIQSTYEQVPQRDHNEIKYYEMEPSKASCQGISTTTIPSKTYEVSEPKHFRFTNLTMNSFKKNV